ncbi:MAG: efflux RND transporter periplasmic adaptor subunit [Acidobacteria bacterium]|nr:efflux RND transporter periplasmic adaptor subunit [Acidobacteriota bacterium]
MLAVVTAACSAKEPPAAASTRRSEGVPVSVATVGQRDVPMEVQVIGNVEAYSTILVKARVNGQLTQVHFREGDYVKKGERLFSLDPRPFEAQLNQAEANMAREEAQLNQAQANLNRDLAQQKYVQEQAVRFARLLQEGIVSKDQAEQMRTGADTIAHVILADQAAIRSAEAAVGAGRAAVANAKVQLSYATISSPIDGRTGNLAINEGNLVTANATDLITINQVKPIYVTFAVPEAHLLSVKRYMAQAILPVEASPQEDSSARQTGQLVFVDNTVDATTGTIKLKGTFTNQENRLWPGQFVRVALRLTTHSNALVVPNQAIQAGQDGVFVYVVKPDRSVESRPVVTGARVDQDVVVQSGVQAGETVVTEGHLRLAPGMRVQPRDEKGTALKGKKEN